MNKPWERMPKWRDEVYKYYAQPQPTHSGFSNDELQGMGKNFLMDDSLWRISGELLVARTEIERLTKRLNQIASVAHAGGEAMTEGAALVEIRRLSLPYWTGAALAAKEDKT